MASISNLSSKKLSISMTREVREMNSNNAKARAVTRVVSGEHPRSKINSKKKQEDSFGGAF